MYRDILGKVISNINMNKPKNTVESLIYFLLLIFFVKPNFNTLGFVTRIGDAVCVGLLLFFYIYISYQKIFKLKSKIISFVFLLSSYCISMIYCVFSFSRYFFADINEIFRVPLFMILPLCIGKYLVNGDDRRFDMFCQFFIVLYFYNIIINIFQFFNVFHGIFYILYSQIGLGFGAFRTTGVALFMQENAWLIYITAAMMIVHRYKKNKKNISGIILSAPVLLTLSKTVYLSYIILTIPFSFNKKAKIAFGKLIATSLLLVFVGILCFYLLKENLQFMASIVNGFSDKSTSISNRQGQILTLFNDLKLNPFGYIFGINPILSQIGVRVEASFFNIFSKIGIIGTISYYCCINMLLFVRQYGPKFIVLLRNIIVWVGISLSLVSVTGGSIEGVKGMFFYFLIIGVILSYNNKQICT
jgi:hypothetical protein